MELYKGQLKNVKFDIQKRKSHHRNKDGSYNINYYDNDILTFDIETTSAWIDENGDVIPYSKGKDAEYWNELQPVALCYIWQFGFNDKIYYGRELKDFVRVLDDLPPKSHFIIWVHNLSWEFQFLTSVLEWGTVFARNSHKTMKCTLKDRPNIEFRCSYFLTRLSLDAWGKQIGEKKKTGDLDYEILRTPLTLLTPKEMGYCESDLLVMYKGLLKYREQYGNVRDIPLTQTGTVRKVVREKLTDDAQYVRLMKKLLPRDAEEYQMLMDLFAGGYTHANRLHSGKVIDLVDQKGFIHHYDFSSSYPTCMVCEKFPMTPFVNKYNYLPSDEEFDECAFILRLRFKNINSKNYNTYIQGSKCYDVVNAIYDNGRIIKADALTMLMTEQDYITIKNNYNYSDIEVIECWKSYKDYLPKEFIKYVYELYANKTSLKDVDGFEDLYMQSKQYINSLFGMFVTAIVQASIIYNAEDGSWTMQKLTADYIEDKLDKLRNFNPREKRQFTSYAWGCWVTAYARRNIWSCIERCGNYGKDVLYVDTDSIFCLGEHSFAWYDEQITDKLKKACDYLDLDFELTRPKTPQGKAKPLGIFTEECLCTQFVTLGAKRYCERRIYIPHSKEADGNLHLTISGINKEAVDLLGDNIYNFIDGFEFDKDSDYVTKKLSTYINHQPKIRFPDGYISEYTTGINLRRTGYKLSLTDEYKELIDYINNPDELEEFDDIYEQRMRAFIW